MAAARPTAAGNASGPAVKTGTAGDQRRPPGRAIAWSEAGRAGERRGSGSRASRAGIGAQASSPAGKRVHARAAGPLSSPSSGRIVAASAEAAGSRAAGGAGRQALGAGTLSAGEERARARRNAPGNSARWPTRLRSEPGTASAQPPLRPGCLNPPPRRTQAQRAGRRAGLRDPPPAAAPPARAAPPSARPALSALPALRAACSRALLSLPGGSRLPLAPR